MDHIPSLRKGRALLRLVTFAIACGAGLLWMTLSLGHAQLSETARGFGQQLWAMHSESRGKLNQLHLNGARFQLLSMSFDEPLDRTMRRFESRCVDRISGSHVPSSDESWPGVFRHVFQGEGIVACFSGGLPSDVDQLAHRLHAFSQDTDLSHFGGIRYVYLRERDAKTTAIVTWSEGPMILSSLFSSSVDVPGRDFPGMIRPEASRRVMSAALSGVPYEMVSYQTDAVWAPARFEALLAQHGQQGWRIHKTDDERVTLLSRGRQQVLVQCGHAANYLSFIQLASP